MAYFLPSALILVVLLLLGSNSQGLYFTDNKNASLTKNSYGVKRLSNARFNFALNSLRLIAEIEKEDNIFYSPHNLHKALGLAYFGSHGKTKAGLRKILRLPKNFSKVDFAQTYAFERSNDILRNKNSSKGYEYRSANRLWLSSAKNLRKRIIRFFGNELKPTDFKTDPEATRQLINQWVEKVTKGNIKDLLSNSAVDRDTNAVLTNAVYFKGLWKSSFDPESTMKDKFYLNQANAKLTEFMNQGDSFNYTFSQKLGAEILQLPYKGEDISMHILLPPLKSSNRNKPAKKNQHQTDSLYQLLNRITNLSSKGAKELRNILENGVSAQEVKITIPKFNLESELSVAKLLMAMNAGSIFDSGVDFSEFVQDGEMIVNLSDAVHKAKIEVNEGGTTAAATTRMDCDMSSGRIMPPHFNANHPFVYFIYDRPGQVVLFAGIFRNPKNT